MLVEDKKKSWMLEKPEKSPKLVTSKTEPAVKEVKNRDRMKQLDVMKMKKKFQRFETLAAGGAAAAKLSACVVGTTRGVPLGHGDRTLPDEPTTFLLGGNFFFSAPGGCLEGDETTKRNTLFSCGTEPEHSASV